jgi:hypothetical protein
MASRLLYESWARGFLSHSVPLATTLMTIPHLDINKRKILLSMTRIQVPLSRSSYMRSRFGGILLEEIVVVTPSGKSRGKVLSKMDFSDFICSTEALYASPIICGVISAAVRTSPYEDYTSVIETRDESIGKEISAAFTYSRPERFNYQVIFGSSPAHRHMCWSARHPPRPTIAKSLHDDFIRAKSQIHNMTIFPDRGTKTVGRETSKAFQEAIREVPELFELLEVQEVTASNLEKMYHWTGHQIQGPTEVRSAWKYSQLKPRVYYARGGNAFHSSKYIQPIWNILLDAIEETHRQNRFQPPKNFMLGPDDICIIYDYPSFTSLLDELKAFTEELANFLRGTIVRILDTREGFISVDVGDLFEDYNSNCNMWPEIDLSRFLPFMDVPTHHTTGMLGVSGNIFSCTGLHGINLRFCSDIDDSRTVGDDGKAYVRVRRPEDQRDAVEEFIYQTNALGEIVEEKSAIFHDIEIEQEKQLESWHFVKRPFWRLGSRMISGNLVTFPALDNILNLPDDGFHFILPSTARSRCILFAKQWKRTLTQIHIEIGAAAISEVEQEIVLKYYRMALKYLEPWDNLDRHRPLDRRHWPLEVCRDQIGRSLVEIYKEIPTTEEYEVAEPAGSDEDLIGYVGEVVRKSSGKIWSLLESLGYVDILPRYTIISKESVSENVFYSMLTVPYRHSVDIRVNIAPLPDWCLPYMPGTIIVN